MNTANIPRGEQRHNAKMTAAAVLDGRRRYSNGEITMPEWAAERGIDIKTARYALRGITWRHVGCAVRAD